MITLPREPWRGGQICGWQTAYGLPWSIFCGEFKETGSPLCEEHDYLERMDGYGSLPKFAPSRGRHPHRPHPRGTRRLHRAVEGDRHPVTTPILDERVTFDGREIVPGESFRPFEGDDYTVTYLRIDRTPSGELLVLADCCGEFTHPIRDLRKGS